MGKSGKRMLTYIQGDISPEQSEFMQMHMDTLEFGATINPGEFATIGKEKMIYAKRNVVGGWNQLPMHSHSFLEIFQYISDNTVEYLIGNHRYWVHKGDIVCIPPGICHQVLHIEPPDVLCTRNLIAVSPVFLESLDWKSTENASFVLRPTADHDSIGSLCEICVRECEQKEKHWKEMLIGYVQILLLQLLRSTDTAVMAERGGLLEQILSYVDENLGRRITLSETAAKFYVSERTVNRECQKNLGTSFYRHVTKRRLLLAVNLIRSGMPFEQVCEHVGYADYPTFYRAFKKEFGISPRQLKLSSVFGE